MHLITEDTFIEQFQPQVNTRDPHASFDLGYGGCLYETYGADLEAVKVANPAHVWTLVEADGAMYLVSGFRIVDRLGYLLTAKPVRAGEEYAVTLDGAG
jgi:hypothetical protein